MSVDPPKVIAMGNGQPDKLRESLRFVQANAEAMIEYYVIDAKIRRARYLALIAEGFTEAQALELTKS